MIPRAHIPNRLHYHGRVTLWDIVVPRKSYKRARRRFYAIWAMLTLVWGVLAAGLWWRLDPIGDGSLDPISYTFVGAFLACKRPVNPPCL